MEWIKRKPKIEYRESDDITTKIAKIRGIEEHNIDDFLMPTEKELFDANEMRGSQEAISLLKYAIDNDLKVVVSVDPDVDGLTSSAMAIRYMREYVTNVDYIYSQREDGHGIYTQMHNASSNDERVQLNELNREKVAEADLLIIVDSSSNDIEGIKAVNELNPDIKILIIDHHQMESLEMDEFENVVLVNPQHPDCEYPNKDLSGAGVVFKILGITEEALEFDGKVNVNDFYDLVAVGMK